MMPAEAEAEAEAEKEEGALKQYNLILLTYI